MRFDGKASGMEIRKGTKGSGKRAVSKLHLLSSRFSLMNWLIYRVAKKEGESTDEFSSASLAPVTCPVQSNHLCPCQLPRNPANLRQNTTLQTALQSCSITGCWDIPHTLEATLSEVKLVQINHYSTSQWYFANTLLYSSQIWLSTVNCEKKRKKE